MNKTRSRKTEQGKAAIIVTYSMYAQTLDRLDQLVIWLHMKTKSSVIQHLVDKEYLNQAALRDDEAQS